MSRLTIYKAIENSQILIGATPYNQHEVTSLPALCSKPEGLRPNICPALLLSFHQLNNASWDITNRIMHIGFVDFLSRHRVLAGNNRNTRFDRLGNTSCGRRFHPKHMDTGAVDNNFNIDIVFTKVILRISCVVKAATTAIRQ